MENETTDYSDEFYSSFMTAGSVLIDCDCGRTHVATDGLPCLEEEEIESIKKLKEKYPDKVIEWDCDSISWTWIQGKQIVFDCPCKIDKIFMNVILEHRTQIMDFFKRVNKIKQKQLEAETELLQSAIQENNK